MTQKYTLKQMEQVIIFILDMDYGGHTDILKGNQLPSILWCHFGVVDTS